MKGLALALLLILPGVAQARLAPATLAGVSVQLPPGARLDLGLAARDSRGAWQRLGAIIDGRPAFVNFVDYTCNTLCGTDLMLLADAITRAGLKPDQYRIIVIGIDPKDSAAAARKMETDEISPALRPAAYFLMPDAHTLAAATTALGFRYAYDPDTDQFAHPAAVYAVTLEGKVRAVLSPLALTSGDLRAVLAPGPSLIQRLHALCYGYDPATGTYTLRVVRLLQAAAAATLLAMAAGLFLVSWRRRRA